MPACSALKQNFVHLGLTRDPVRFLSRTGSDPGPGPTPAGFLTEPGRRKASKSSESSERKGAKNPGSDRDLPATP